jgi:hypothetical protein
MRERIRILFLSANPMSVSRILVDEEFREITERLQEGPYRDKFELHNHMATRPEDLQKLMLTYQPHIVHFSCHGNKQEKIILDGTKGKGKTVEREGLAGLLALYNRNLRLVVLNACLTKVQARCIAEVVNYSIGTSKGIGDKVAVIFAGAFYRALGFGMCVREAFESAKAELALTRISRSRGIELFVQNGVGDNDQFPQIDQHRVHPNAQPNGSFTFSVTHTEHQFSLNKSFQQIALN